MEGTSIWCKLAMTDDFGNFVPTVKTRSDIRGLKREDWLQKVQEDGFDWRSTLLEYKFELLSKIVRCHHFCLNTHRRYALSPYGTTSGRHGPTKKVLVFLESLFFLDILDKAFTEHTGTKPLRFDGTMSDQQRTAARDAFEEGPADVPLFITAGSGGVGLNLVVVSIVVQTEPWWNSNVERQAWARAHRQGQKEEVIIIRMEAKNSSLETHILKVQESKSKANRRIMEALQVPWDEMPRISSLPPIINLQAAATIKQLLQGQYVSAPDVDINMEELDGGENSEAIC